MIRFGDDFELDPAAYQLRRAGHALKLERIPMEILLLLAERHGQLVSREQIVERIWGQGHFLDTDNSINGAIRKIRQVLKDDSEQPRFIETVTGRGYRFIAPVLEPQASDAGTPKDIVPPLPAPRASPRARRASGAALVLFVVLAAAAGVLWSRTRAPTAAGGRVTLAVLPFQNLTGDAEQEYFSDGLTEEMIAQLGSMDPRRLQVIARTSVMRYKAGQTPLQRIARELGVQYVLEGSVRRAGNDVRVTAQLIQTKGQTHIWAQQYDRELKDLLALQGEIAQRIAVEIQAALGGDTLRAGSPPARSVPEYAAYDLYLKGLYFFNKRTVPDFEKAIGYFEQATIRDPGYARAHALLADSYTLLIAYSGRRPLAFELLPKARAAALKALALDPGSAEGHTALALIVQNHDWDWRTAEQEYRRAIELNPNYATARHWYAEHLMWRGRFPEALEESERARQLDPLSLIIQTDHAVILQSARQYDRAIEQFRSVLELDPDFPRTDLIGMAYVDNGMIAAALAHLESRRHKISARAYWSNLTCIHGRSGQIAKAREALREVFQVSRDTIDPADMAKLFACVGDKEQALAWLETAYAERAGGLITLNVYAGFDSLRSDPRFQSVLRRVGLAH